MLFVAFWIGLVIQDLYNKDSWLHKYWRDWNRLFDVHTLHSEHVRDDPERVAVYVLLKFIRKIRGGELVVTVVPSYKGASPFVTHKEVQLNSAAFEDRKLTICTLRVPRPHKLAIHSLWGETIGGVTLEQGQQSVTPQSKNLVSIAVRGGWRRQKFDFMVDFLHADRLNESYVYLQREDDILFDVRDRYGNG